MGRPLYSAAHALMLTDFRLPTRALLSMTYPSPRAPRRRAKATAVAR